jgi:hypothetical protein
MELYGVKTWFDTRHGVVALEDDVLGIVQRLKELGEGRISVYYNEQSDGYDIVERCLDGTDRLVFSVDKLDQRCVDRLLTADHWGSENPDHRDDFLPESEDFASQMDRDNEELLQGHEEKSRDKLRAAGERLGWALEEDGRGLGASILVEKDVSARADDAHRTRRGADS